MIRGRGGARIGFIPDARPRQGEPALELADEEGKDEREELAGDLVVLDGRAELLQLQYSDPATCSVHRRLLNPPHEVQERPVGVDSEGIDRVVQLGRGGGEKRLEEADG